jgi:choline dehydrogenase-like flavoprotein
VQSSEADVVIVGSGLMGAAVARLIRDSRPECSILMVDGGPRLGDVPGQHLYNAVDPTLSAQYAERTSSGNQAFYTGAATGVDLGADIVGAEPGMYNLAAFGNGVGGMTAAALAWNVGGMGVHWSAATPWPWGSEVIDFIPTHEWSRDLKTAQRLLRVRSEHHPESPEALAVLATLREFFAPVTAPGRHAQFMPMAVDQAPDGRLYRTGPSSIFGPMATGEDPRFELRSGEQATEVLRAGRRTLGVRLQNVRSGTEYAQRAGAVVVCADTLRTPQLLFASGIRPAALGRYLNEHAFLSGHVVVDPDRSGVLLDDADLAGDGVRRTDAFWLPHSGGPQPFHGQFVGKTVLDGTTPRYALGLAMYVPTEMRRECRVEFSDKEADLTGMPRMSVVFDYSAEDLDLIERARATQSSLAERFGAFDPSADSTLLPAGSSLHFSGTVRMGTSDDGTSVCDPDGRVWDFDNLYVAGNGVVPTALACNSTLTGMVTAARAARAVGQHIGPGHVVSEEDHVPGRSR